MKKRRHQRKSTNSFYNKFSFVRNIEKTMTKNILLPGEYPPTKWRMKAQSSLYEQKSNWRIWDYLNLYSLFSKRNVRINKYTRNALEPTLVYIYLTLNYNLCHSTSLGKITSWARRTYAHTFRLLNFLEREGNGF